MIKTMHDHIHDLALDAYLAYFNFYADDISPTITLDELTDEIFPLDEFRPIDDSDFEYANAFYMRFTYDTCSIDLILTLTYDPNRIATKLDRALISTDTMPYADLLNPDHD